MKIVLRDITKRFIKSNVLDHINYQFELGKVYGINGANGTGKSTLLKIISGAMVPSAGKLEYYLTDQEIADSEIYKYISYYASGDELIEEFSPREVFHHVKKYKTQKSKFQSFIKFVDLVKEADQLIETFSSGMKQRLALGLVLNSENPILLMDEPVTFLDEHKKSWFYEHLNLLKTKGEKLIIIASNEPDDFKLCDKIINI